MTSTVRRAVEMTSVASTKVAEGASGIQVAQASITQVQEPSKTTKAWNWTKNNLPRIAYSVALAAAIVLLGNGISAGITSSLAFAGYALTSAITLVAVNYEYKKATSIEEHAKEFYEAVKFLDDLNPTSNKFVTAKQRYIRAAQTILEDLVKLNPSDKEAFVKRIANAAKHDVNFRINTEDGRYLINMDEKVVTFEEFVRLIVNIEVEKIKNFYNEELNSYTETVADVLKKDIMMSSKIRESIMGVVQNMASNEKYRMLGKNVEEIYRDLLDKIKNKLGERYVKREIGKLESLMTDRRIFWRNVENFRKAIRRNYSEKYKSREEEIANYEKRLQELKNEENKMEKELVSKLAIGQGKDEGSSEKIEEYKEKAAEFDARRQEIEGEKERIRQEITRLREEQAGNEEMSGYNYLIELNARRRELSELLGQEVQDLEMPKHPTKADAFKYWLPKAAFAGVALAGVSMGTYYALPVVAPIVSEKVQDWVKSWFKK